MWGSPSKPAYRQAGVAVLIRELTEKLPYILDYFNHPS